MHHIPVIVGRGLILFPNHTVYIQLWEKEVPQHVEVLVTRSGTSGEREWSVNLCSANSTENFHLLAVSRMFEFDADSVILRWLDYDDSPSQIS
jgi:hypothetical protein